MTRRARTVLAAGIVLIVLIALAVWALRLPPPEAPPSVSPFASSQPTSLPAAEGDSRGGLVGKVSDGITLTLLGVNVADDVQSGWQADGEPLPGRQVDHLPTTAPTHPQMFKFELPIRLAGADHDGRPWNALNLHWSARGAGLGLAPHRSADHQMISNEFVLIGLFPMTQETTDVRIDFAVDPADTVAVIRVPVRADAPAAQPVSADVPNLGKVTLANPRDVNNAATITATIPTPPKTMQVVVRAVAHARKFIAAVPPASALRGTGGESRDITFTAPLADVAAFQIEVRDYSTFIEFRDVSLRPGARTSPRVVTSDTPPDAGMK